MNMCCTTWCANGGVVFEWNGSAGKRRQIALVFDTKMLLSFGVPGSKFEACIGATRLTEKFEGWARAIDPEGQYFTFAVVERNSRPTWLLARPTLSTTD